MKDNFVFVKRVSSQWVTLFYTFIELRAFASIFIVITLFLHVNCRNEKQETSKEKGKAPTLGDREEMPS